MGGSASGSGSTGSTAASGAEGAASGAAIGTMAAPGIGTAIGAALGAGIGIWGALSAADDQNALDQEKAQVAREQAAEIAAREANNEIINDQAAYRQKLAFGAAYAGSGKSGTGIGSQLEIQRQTDQANMVSNRDSQFQIQMLNQQAGVDTTLGAETLQAGEINAIGQGVSGATKVGTIMTSGNSSPGLGGTQPLPSWG